MRKELASALVAIVLAFLVVQGASLLQNPPAAAVKGDFVTEAATRQQAGVLPPTSWNEMLSVVILVPLMIAGLSYLLVRRAV